MLHQIEGSKAMARAIALCRPQVVCAYPITPQTHIVEGLGELIRLGELDNCEFINVESEFAALSVAIGASAAGARAYTATASQGLLFMAEAVYNAAGLGLPIVMTLGTAPLAPRSTSGTIIPTRWRCANPAGSSCSPNSNQEAADLHIVAFRLAEELSVPTMVCVDGFILTHAVERIDLPDQALIDAYLPPYEPMQSLDPADPISIGAMVGPDAFTEVRYLQYFRQHTALALIDKLAAEFEQRFGRQAGGLLRTYEAADAETLVVAMGSINGTIKDVIDEMRADGIAIGLVTLVAFRPFPAEALREALARARDVVVIDRAVDVGMGGPLASNIAIALRDLPNPPAMHSAIVGLGGRPTPKASLHRLFRQAAIQPWEGPHFLDLNERVVARELHRARQDAPRRPGRRGRPQAA